MDINITIEGTVPLLLNRFTDQAARDATNGTRGSSAAAERSEPRDIADSKLYRGADGTTLVIPAPNLMRCLVQGGSFHKAGKTKITTQRGSLMFACLEIEGAEVPIEHRQPWRVDERPVRIPSTGGRILAYRPMFDDWTLSFTVKLDTAIVGPKLLRQIVDDAGARIGLGDFRPASNGPYGRFVVTKWAEDRAEKPALKAAA